MIDKRVFSTHAIQPSRRNRLFSQYIIKDRFQFKFSLVLTGLMALGMFLLWWEGNVMVDRAITEKMIINDEVIKHFQLLTSMQGKSLVLLAAVFFGFNILLSHFIAGPIYRIEKTLEGIRDGNLAIMVRFRKRDPFAETAEMFNQALSSLRLRLKKQVDINSTVQDKTKKIVEVLRSKGCHEEALEIDQLMEKLKESSAQVKIS